jgi:hypothetical protein
MSGMPASSDRMILKHMQLQDACEWHLYCTLFGGTVVDCAGQ